MKCVVKCIIEVYKKCKSCKLKAIEGGEGEIIKLERLTHQSVRQVTIVNRPNTAILAK